MGTSTGYKAPSSPPWAVVKSDVTRAARDGRPGIDVSRRVLKSFIQAAGGPARVAAGGGSLGRTQAAQRVAAEFAAFIRAVADNGLPLALGKIGLSSLVGRPITEVLDALLDHLGGAANSLDDVDARNALSHLWEEMFAEIDSPDDLEAALASAVDVDRLGELLTTFFSLYLFEQFTRVFYERLVARVGDSAAAIFLDGIRDYIRSAVGAVHPTRDLSTVDWSSATGRAVAADILEDTLFVFAGTL